MNKEEKRKFVRNEIMTMEDVLITLKISKQYLYQLKKKERLVPFISSKGTNIYWKDDVLEYARTSMSKYSERLSFINNNKEK